MSQAKVTVSTDGVVLAIVTFSAEYGPTVMANQGVDVQVEETEYRAALGQVLALPQDGDLGRRPPLQLVPPDIATVLDLPAEAMAEQGASTPEVVKGKEPPCFSCEHPFHEGECTHKMTGVGAEPDRLCGCMTYIP